MVDSCWYGTIYIVGHKVSRLIRLKNYLSLNCACQVEHPRMETVHIALN